MPEVEESLWRAVISQAIDDATRARPSGICTATDIAAARNWLKGGHDFDAVCELAGLNPDVVRAYALQVVEAPSISPDQTVSGEGVCAASPADRQAQ